MRRSERVKLICDSSKNHAAARRCLPHKKITTAFGVFKPLQLNSRQIKPNPELFIHWRQWATDGHLLSINVGRDKSIVKGFSDHHQGVHTTQDRPVELSSVFTGRHRTKLRMLLSWSHAPHDFF